MEKHTYDLDELVKVCLLAQNAKLDGVNILDKYKLSEIQDMANGIGSQSMPKWLRELVSVINPALEPVALIHDIEWSQDEKSKENFKETNQRFRKNGYIMAKHNYGWYDPRRYRVMMQATRFAKICQLFGWKAYLSGKSGKLEDYSCDEAEVNNEKI